MGRRMDTAYQIDAGTVRWARTRVQQISEAELEIGVVLERLEGTPKSLRDGADLMDDQPDSDRIRSFADSLEKLINELEADFGSTLKDRNDIRRGIRKYEEATHDYDT